MKRNQSEPKTNTGIDTEMRKTSPSEVDSYSDEKEYVNNGPHEHTILIVDDEPSILSALQRTLRQENYNILTSENLSEALQLALNNQISVIISDFNMPGGTGADLLRMVKAKRPRCVRIMMTGASNSRSVPDGIADLILHCQKYVRKPFDDSKIKTMIRESIKLYESSGEKDTSVSS